MKKQTHFFVLLFLLLLILSGCPYEFKTEIIDAENSISAPKILNSRYTGKTPDGVNTEFVIKESGNKLYKMELLRYEKDGEKTDTMTVRFFDIDNIHLVQIQNNSGFYIFKYYMAGYRIYIWNINQKLAEKQLNKNAKASNLQAFFSENTENKELFTDKTQFMRFESKGANAQNYLNFILKEQNEVIKFFGNIYAAKSNKDKHQNHYSLQQQIDKSSHKIKSLQRYDGSYYLKNEAIKLFEVYKDVADNELAELLKMMKKKKGDKKTIDKKAELENSMNSKLDKAKKDWKSATDEFKKKYQIN